MKILITGIAGFVGGHLAEYCLKQSCEVHGLDRLDSEKKLPEAIDGKIHLHNVDIRDTSALMGMLYKIRPDRIFHLAAQSYVPLSWRSPQDTLATNILGQANLFEALRELGLKPRVHVAGSSEEYGWVAPSEIPIVETNPLRPLSPYAVSKVTQDLMAYQYHRSYNLHAVRTRAFNHTGPRRGEHFVTSSFARQIALIESGQQKSTMYTGNLDAIRDFSDVRDIVRAYWMALETCESGEVYNICSETGRSIADVLKIYLTTTKSKIDIRKDPARLRISDLPIVVGSSKKFREATGWTPEIPFEQTLEDLLNDWRRRVKETPVTPDEKVIA